MSAVDLYPGAKIALSTSYTVRYIKIDPTSIRSTGEFHFNVQAPIYKQFVLSKGQNLQRLITGRLNHINIV